MRMLCVDADIGAGIVQAGAVRLEGGIKKEA